MTYAEMKFVEVRGHSAGYNIVFENGRYKNFGQEISDNASERLIENAREGLGDRDTKLCRAADGKLYKVVGNEQTAAKFWTEVELIENRAERIKEFREFSVGTLQSAQEASGVLFQNISKFETGSRDIRKANGETLLKIAEAYGVTIEELIK